MPLLDEQQSYTLLLLKESDGQTTMTFQRTITSCDEQDLHITVRKSDIIHPSIFQLRLVRTRVAWVLGPIPAV